MGIDVLIPIMGILLVMIPVAGLTLGLTVRHAVRPMVETIAKAMRETRGSDQLTVQIAALQDEVESLSLEVRELRSAQDFDRKLLAGQGGTRP
jgi:hypothetical protein